MNKKVKNIPLDSKSFNKPLNYLMGFMLLWLFTACSTTSFFSRKNYRTLDEQVTQSAIFSNIFTGFALYDPVSREFLYKKESDKYYTPASNTKLFTFYTALNVLKDSLPLINYALQGDTLIFWGSGNPLFLHPDFNEGQEALELLAKHPGPLFYSDHHYKDQRFGPGWAWGDYRYYYQVEKSAFPLYGNAVRLIQNDSIPLNIYPPFFADHLKDSTAADYFLLSRTEHSNLFLIDSSRLDTQQIERDLPFRHHKDLVIRLLEDTLHRSVLYHSGPPDAALQTHRLKTVFPDTLYRRLLQDSDNFIAEQLMLMVSDELFGYCETREALNYAVDSLLKALPQKPIWRDGSGLSRYNLMTPESIVKLLELLYQSMPEARLFDLLPAGGQSGTIRNWYAGDPPFVFAKTGTLNAKHCLSGFVKTESGRTLIFSFMNNNYISGSAPVKREMQQVLEWIKVNL
jgi:D-alanyl-D-alanine carboxypeptidase/D-alanyl-D-alanine-endopeptidase (penicillin-binding protein 4)